MIRKLFLGLLPLALAAACAQPPSHTPSLRAIRLPMGYIPNVQFAPFYVAAEKGYFREEGIDLAFDYKFETDGVALVGAGEIPFALVSGEQVPLARAQGLPVVYAMAWWNAYPVAVMAMKASGIQTVQDLKGKKVGIPALSGASYVGFRALLNAEGMKEADLQLNVINYTQVESLVGGQVDAAVVYANNEPVQMRARGYEVNVVRVADFVNLASNGLLTNEKTLKENPDLARAMIRAILHGIRDALADPGGTYAICKKYIDIPAEQDAVQKQVLAATMEFWRSDKPGWSDPAAWQNMEATLQSMGSLTRPLDITQAFTNDYLPK
jgi:NitT/TauT family transport system substrate-binding protein